MLKNQNNYNIYLITFPSIPWLSVSYACITKKNISLVVMFNPINLRRSYDFFKYLKTIRSKWFDLTRAYFWQTIDFMI